jgi:uncharacterized protein YndB with AHSA1/START domain
MRILKFILKLLGLLLIVFLLTGLFIKKVDYIVEIEVDKSLEETWTLFNDHTVMDQWVKGVKSFDPIDTTSAMVGNTYKMIVEDNGREIEMIETITAWEPNTRIVMEFDAGDMHKVNDIRFASKDGKTIITNDASCRGTTYFTKCMFPYFKGMFRNIDKEMFEDFKKMVESR